MDSKKCIYYLLLWILGVSGITQNTTAQGKNEDRHEQEEIFRMPKKFSPLFFDSGESKLKPEEQEKLNKLAEILKLHPEIKFRIFGYADELNSDEFNLKLSSERADTVAAYLEKKEIGDQILEVKGFGELKPVVPNTSAENRQKNRRVELKFEKQKQE